MGSPEHAGSAFHGLFRQFNWQHISLLYYNYNVNAGRGNSDCSFSMRAIQGNFPNIVASQVSFDEKEETRDDFLIKLNEIKKRSRSKFEIKVY